MIEAPTAVRPTSARGFEPHKLESRRKTVMSVFEREHQFAKIQRERREDDVKRGILQELHDCTFTPAIRSAAGSPLGSVCASVRGSVCGPTFGFGAGAEAEARSVGKFLREQQAHSTKRERALAHLVSARDAQEKALLQSRPTISQVLSIDYS